MQMETRVARFHYNGFKIFLSFRKADIIKAFLVVVCITENEVVRSLLMSTNVRILE